MEPRYLQISAYLNNEELNFNPKRCLGNLTGLVPGAVWLQVGVVAMELTDGLKPTPKPSKLDAHGMQVFWPIGSPADYGTRLRLRAYGLGFGA